MIETKVRHAGSSSHGAFPVTAEITGISSAFFAKIRSKLALIGEVGKVTRSGEDAFRVEVRVPSHFSCDATGKVNAVFSPHTFRDLVAT